MIRDVHHIGIAVRDLEEALALYRDTLSLTVVKHGDAAARGARVALLAVSGSYLEVIQPTSADSPFARFIEERGEGLHHVALSSDGVDQQVKLLREQGVPLEDVAPRAGFTGRLSYLLPGAFDGAIIEVVEPAEELGGHSFDSQVTGIDHVVFRVPGVAAFTEHMLTWFGVATKRTFERGDHTFAFLRPGTVILEVVGPTSGGEAGSGRIAGLALEVKGIDELAASIKAKGYPIGEPHPALQGGRIVSVHHSGACGVPLAFIDFTGSPGPAPRNT
jgi:methylmalonyl-CoA/ethylmalonyl-CoA epimerase